MILSRYVRGGGADGMYCLSILVSIWYCTRLTSKIAATGAQFKHRKNSATNTNTWKVNSHVMFCAVHVCIILVHRVSMIA